MASRATFRATTRLDPNQRARYDTAAGTTTPADICYVESGTAIPGGIIRADWDGRVPAVLGPEDVDTLFLKPISAYTGAVTGSPVAVVAVLPVAPEATLTGDAGSLVGPSGGLGVGLFNPPRRTFPSIRDTPITEFQSGHGWTKTSSVGTMSADTSDYVLGSQSLSLVTDGAAGTVLISSPTLSPVVDLSAQQLVLWIKLDDSIPAGRYGDFQVRVTSNAWTDWAWCKPAYSALPQQWLEPGVWNPLTLSAAEAPADQRWGSGGWQYYGTKTNVNWAAINGVRFRLTDSGTGAMTVKVNMVGYSPRPTKAMLSLLFLDGLASTWTVARPALDKYRLPATALVIPELLGAPGYLTRAQVRALARTSKWSIGAHGFSQNRPPYAHQRGYDGISYSAGESDLLRTKAALEALGVSGGNFIGLPQGSWNANVVGGTGVSTDVLGMVRKYMDVCSVAHSNTLETFPPADPYKLRAGTVTYVQTAAKILAVIDAAIAGKAWLLMNFHDLVSTAGVSTDATTAVFNTVVDGIATRVAAGNLLVRTPEEILQYGAV